MTQRTTRTVALVVLLVVSSIAGGAAIGLSAAQSQAGTNESGNSTGDNSTVWVGGNSSWDTSESQPGVTVNSGVNISAEGNGDSGRGVGNHSENGTTGSGPDVSVGYSPDVGENSTGGGLVNWVLDLEVMSMTGYELLAAGWKWTLENTIVLAIGTPVMENSGWHNIFGEPTGQYQNGYNTIVEGIVYPLLIPGLTVMILIASLRIMLATGAGKGVYSVSNIAWGCFMGITVFVFSWPYVSFLHNFSNALAMTITPGADELTNSVGSVMKSVAGPVFAAIGMALVGWTEAVALGVIYGMRRALLEALPFAFPIIVFLRFFGGNRVIKLFGSVLLWQYHALVFMTLPTAFVFRVAYMLDWSFTAGGVGNVFVTLGLFFGVLIMPLFMSGSALLAPFLLPRLGQKAGAGSGRAGSWARRRYQKYKGEGDEGGPQKDQSHRGNPNSGQSSTNPVADGGTSNDQSPGARGTTTATRKQARREGRRAEWRDDWDDRQSIRAQRAKDQSRTNADGGQ